MRHLAKVNEVFYLNHITNTKHMRELVSRLFCTNNGNCVHDEQLMSDCGQNDVDKAKDYIEKTSKWSLHNKQHQIDWYENESKTYSCVVR